MLKSKIVLSVIIFLFLFSLTSFLKNETRIIEKNINSIRLNINNLQKKKFTKLKLNIITYRHRRI